jgi:hypothetical protein
MSVLVDGVPRREHLKKAAGGLFQDGPAIEAAALLANEPPLPTLSSDYWNLFLELHVRRDRDENGPLRFLWRDLQSYSEVTGVRFDPFTRRVLFAMEDEYFAVVAQNKKTDSKKK